MIPALIGLKKIFDGVLAFLSGVPREVWYALAIAGILWGAYDWAYDRGRAACEAKYQAAALQAERDARRQDAENESTTTTAADNLAGAVANDTTTIQDATHASSERIRIIYRDRPAPPVACDMPDGVHRELEAARARANAAAGRL